MDTPPITVVRHVFIGPNVEGQKELLRIAIGGADCWNAWRDKPENQDKTIDFSGIDFKKSPQDSINFSGFHFGDHVNFSNCKFYTEQEFIDAKFGHKANFSSAVFTDISNFHGASFLDDANFSDAELGSSCTFEEAVFGNDANFENAIFLEAVRFNKAKFLGDVSFDGATFGSNATFVSVEFFGMSHFQGQESDRWKKLADKTKDRAEPLARDRINKQLWERIELRTGHKPDKFQKLDFSRARFADTAHFSNRKFEDTASFKNAIIQTPPVFDGATNTHRLDFTHADVSVSIANAPFWKRSWTVDSDIPIRFRAFRKIADDTKNHDLERDLYIEERKAERGVYFSNLWQRRKDAENNIELLENARSTSRLAAHSLWIAIMGLYALLADYGRSFMRPLIALALSIPFFQHFYRVAFADTLAKAIADPSNTNFNADAYRHAIDMVGLGNAVPFVGPLTIDADIKKFLFCGKVGEALKNCAPVPPESYQWLVLTQNLVSITLVFFIGLALRNYFKIK